MKLASLKIIFYLLLFFIFYFLFKYFSLAYQNYQGFCFDTKLKVSKEKKIEASIEKLLFYYPKNEKELSRYIEKNLHTNNLSSVGLKPILYKDKNHFMLLNENCCRIFRQAEDIEDARASFFDRITGAKSDFVNIHYRLRFSDLSGEITEQKKQVTYAVTNCGVVWDGF